MWFRSGGGGARISAIAGLTILTLTITGGTVMASASDASFPSHMRVQLQRLMHLHQPQTTGAELQHVQTIRDAYDALDYQPLWTDSQGWQPKADFLLEYIGNAYQHGLDTTRYHRDTLSRLQDGNTLAQRIHSELLLSDAFLRLLEDLTPPAGPRALTDSRTVQLLLKIRPGNDPAKILDAQLPQDREYWALSRALKGLLAEEPQVERRPLKGALKPGDVAPEVHLLSERLRQSGDFSGPASELFTVELATALRDFQQRHGLEADGIVGPATRQQLNASSLDRIEQIVLNLERRRRLSQPRQDTEIRVNIAAQQLQYRHEGRTTLEMRVIAGRPERPTPLTAGKIDQIVLNPDWTVPYRIAVKDKLPQIRQDPTYLSRHGFTVRDGWSADAEFLDPLSIDWNRVEENNFPYVLRQLPGQNNALGRVKFLFPNEFSVYLHDTPARHLFEQNPRLFSSGCIRLAEPMRLAELMLQHYAPEASATLPPEAEETRHVRLERPVPVFLEYWTAWVDDAGELNFRPDVYARDHRLLAELTAADRQPQAARLVAQRQMADDIRLARNQGTGAAMTTALASP